MGTTPATALKLALGLSATLALAGTAAPASAADAIAGQPDISGV